VKHFWCFRFVIFPTDFLRILTTVYCLGLGHSQLIKSDHSVEIVDCFFGRKSYLTENNGCLHYKARPYKEAGLQGKRQLFLPDINQI